MVEKKHPRDMHSNEMSSCFIHSCLSVFALADVTVHIDKWKTETVLQSSFTSKLLNLGQVTRERIPPGNRNIITIEAFCQGLNA